MKSLNKNTRDGQTMVEYIIIVAVIAIAALVVFGLFGDTIKKKMSGAVSSLDDDLGSEAQTEADTSSADFIKNLDADGTSN
jgi:Flp pilus assembly pilin Flp